MTHFSKEQVDALKLKPGYGVDESIPTAKGRCVITPAAHTNYEPPPAPKEVGDGLGGVLSSQREPWPKMNRWEREFGEYLKVALSEESALGLIHPQGVTLRLARATSYTPDWVVFPINELVPTDWNEDGVAIRFEKPRLILAYEVKGFWRQSGRIKIKMAARLFPAIRFIAVTKKNKKWQFEEISC